eukprot:gene4077-5823_t
MINGNNAGVKETIGQNKAIRVLIRLRPKNIVGHISNPQITGRISNDLNSDDCVEIKSDSIVNVVKVEGIFRSPAKSYTFDKIFTENIDQEEIYTHTADMISSALNGINATILMHGATATGKTYSMMGTPQAPGIIPRAVNDLFEQLDVINQKESENTTSHKMYFIEISYVEFYNNQFRNLIGKFNEIGLESSNSFSYGKTTQMNSPKALKSQSADMFVENGNTNWKGSLRPLVRSPTSVALRNSDKVEVHESKELGVFMTGQGVRVHVTNHAEAMEVIHIGNKNRIVRSNDVHDKSSRGHAILTFHIEIRSIIIPANVQPDDYEKASSELKLSKLHFVDLAGYSVIKSSNAKALIENQNIHLSLTSFGDVLSMLAKKEKLKAQANPPTAAGKTGNNPISNQSKLIKHIPYLNSKLTHVLKDSLGGKAKTVFIVTICADQESYQQTSSSLLYASWAKNIVYTESVMTIGPHHQWKPEDDPEADKLKKDLDDRNQQFLTNYLQQLWGKLTVMVSPPEKSQLFTPVKRTTSFADSKPPLSLTVTPLSARRNNNSSNNLISDDFSPLNISINNMNGNNELSSDEVVALIKKNKELSASNAFLHNKMKQFELSIGQSGNNHAYEFQMQKTNQELRSVITTLQERLRRMEDRFRLSYHQSKVSSPSVAMAGRTRSRTVESANANYDNNKVSLADGIVKQKLDEINRAERKAAAQRNSSIVKQKSKDYNKSNNQKQQSTLLKSTLVKNNNHTSGLIDENQEDRILDMSILLGVNKSDSDDVSALTQEGFNKSEADEGVVQALDNHTQAGDTYDDDNLMIIPPLGMEAMGMEAMLANSSNNINKDSDDRDDVDVDQDDNNDEDDNDEDDGEEEEEEEVVKLVDFSEEDQFAFLQSQSHDAIGDDNSPGIDLIAPIDMGVSDDILAQNHDNHDNEAASHDYLVPGPGPGNDENDDEVKVHVEKVDVVSAEEAVSVLPTLTSLRSRSNLLMKRTEAIVDNQIQAKASLANSSSDHQDELMEGGEGRDHHSNQIYHNQNDDNFENNERNKELINEHDEDIQDTPIGNNDNDNIMDDNNDVHGRDGEEGLHMSMTGSDVLTGTEELVVNEKEIASDPLVDLSSATLIDNSRDDVDGDDDTLDNNNNYYNHNHVGGGGLASAGEPKVMSYKEYKERKARLSSSQSSLSHSTATATVNEDVPSPAPIPPVEIPLPAITQHPKKVMTYKEYKASLLNSAETTVDGSSSSSGAAGPGVTGETKKLKKSKKQNKNH